MRLPNARCNEVRKLNQTPSSGGPVCRAAKEVQEHGRSTQGMSWPALGKESVVRTVIMDDATTVKRAAQHRARGKEATVGVVVLKWWTDGSSSDDSRVGAPAVCMDRDKWRFHGSNLGTRRLEVFDAEL